MEMKQLIDKLKSKCGLGNRKNAPERGCMCSQIGVDISSDTVKCERLTDVTFFIINDKVVIFDAVVIFLLLFVYFRREGKNDIVN